MCADAGQVLVDWNGNEGDKVSVPIDIKQLEAGEDEEWRREVMAETIFAGLRRRKTCGEAGLGRAWIHPGNIREARGKRSPG